MLTPTEITAGVARLQDSKTLKPEDISLLSSVFEMVFAGLTSIYTYEYEDELAELDDSANTKKKAAQVAACIIKLEDLGFLGAKLSGGRSGIDYSQDAEYLKIVLFAFSKIYPIPKEFASFSLKYANWFKNKDRTSSTIMTTRTR